MQFVNLMLAEAIDARASDIHVEPLRDRVTVRFRIDGALHEVMKPPKKLTRWPSSRASRCSPTSTSPCACCRRTGA